MVMRRFLAVLSVALIAACGSGPTSLSTSPTESGSPAADPRGLLGKWAVSGQGVVAGTTLTLRDSSSIDGALSINMPCGEVGGMWAAAGEQSLLVGDVSAGAGACFGASGIQGADWLRRVSAFRHNGDGPELLDANNAIVVSLRRAGPAPTSAAPAAGLGKQFAVPAALPTGSRPPTDADLQGRWLPVPPSPSPAFAAFAVGGRWSGSDGCNGSGGQFVLGREGRLLATSGITTLIGCMGSPLPHWVSQASRVGLVDDELVFYDSEAKELGRAKRDS